MGCWYVSANARCIWMCAGDCLQTCVSEPPEFPGRAAMRLVTKPGLSLTHVIRHVLGRHGWCGLKPTSVGTYVSCIYWESFCFVLFLLAIELKYDTPTLTPAPLPSHSRFRFRFSGISYRSNIRYSGNRGEIVGAMHAVRLVLTYLCTPSRK